MSNYKDLTYRYFSGKFLVSEILVKQFIRELGFTPLKYEWFGNPSIFPRQTNGIFETTDGKLITWYAAHEDEHFPNSIRFEMIENVDGTPTVIKHAYISNVDDLFKFVSE